MGRGDTLVRHLLLSVLFVFLSGLPLFGNAQERIDLEGTSVKGSDENPQVLHLIPWKVPEDVPVVLEPPTMDLDALLKPLDRPRFRSEIYYRIERRVGDLP